MQQYLNHHAAYSAVQRSIEEASSASKNLAQNDSSTQQQAGLSEHLQRIESLFKDNVAIEDEIFHLTAASAQQSNDFLTGISAKLADPALEKQVSTLERLVIAGATANSNASMNTQVLFLKTKADLSISEELLKLVAALLVNAEQDAQALSGTPFAQLPVNAKRSNLRIQELVKRFVDNSRAVHKEAQQITEILQTLVADARQNNTHSLTNAFDLIENNFLIFIFILGAGGALTILINWGVGRAIITSMQRVIAIANQVANFNITAFTVDADAQSREETAQLLYAVKRMTDNLREVITTVAADAHNIENISAEVSSTARQVGNSAMQQASHIESTSSAVEEIAVSIKQSVSNTVTASDLAARAQQQAEQGSSAIVEAMQAMDAISASSGKISNITNVIDDIAFQTNLLALNAAVEAARAGEHGRGFAIVAGEVRKLAQRSAEAAKEIKGLITDSLAKIQSGGSLVASENQVLHSIVTAAQQVNSTVNQIATAASEQATAMQQIHNSMNQLNQFSQSNAAASEELTATALNMNNTAKQLRSVVAAFKLGA